MESASDSITENAKSNTNKIVILESSNGEEFRLPVNVAMMSGLIQQILEESLDNGDNPETINLPNITSEILKKVIEYCEHHYENYPEPIERPLRSASLAGVVSEWDLQYVSLKQKDLFELILAANYLQIEPLLQLTCAKVASILKGKTPSEIRKEFNIVNDFTPEEEAQVREENKWCEES